MTSPASVEPGVHAAPPGQGPAADETARLRAVDEYGLLSGERIPHLDDIVGLAAGVCEVRTAVINVITVDKQIQVAALGFQASDCRRDDAMCAVTVVSPDPVIVSDARTDPRFADNPFVTGVIGTVRFYASTQLRGEAGNVLGTLCVFDNEPRTLSGTQRARLDKLGALVVDVFELRRRTRQLNDAVVERDRTIAELAQLRDALQQSNRTLHQFAGGVAHDLRGPLATMTGAFDLLAEQGGEAAAVESTIHLVRRSADRMQHMIDDLLDYASVGARLRLHGVHVAGIVAAVIEDLAAAINDAGATVEVGDLPLVRADPTKLHILLQNLIANAIKYRHPDRPCRVTIEGATLPHAWLIRVADNGIGIPAAQRDRVMERYVRLGSRSGGIGIGMATCAEIIRAHHGELQITDAPGGGTVVTVRLPR